MRTCHWYAFVLAYENVGIVVAGEEVSISVGRGVCLILVAWESTMKKRGWCAELDGSGSEGGIEFIILDGPSSIHIGSATWSLSLSPFTVSVVWGIVRIPLEPRARSERNGLPSQSARRPHVLALVFLFFSSSFLASSLPPQQTVLQAVTQDENDICAPTRSHYLFLLPFLPFTALVSRVQPTQAATTRQLYALIFISFLAFPLYTYTSSIQSPP
jgi:hypothetical protein